MDDKQFRIEIQKLLVDDNYWKNYDWMNNVTGNEIVIRELKKRIEKYPLIWKMFFKLLP